MQWLNYHHLYYFKIIASEGSIARAAELLRLGQPTLSAQLKQLENMVGKPLFERRSRKLILTEAGRAALDYANEIFRLGDEMLEVLNDRTPENQPHIQIGALDSVPKSIILSLVLRAYKIAPCTVSIFEGNGDELYQELRTHRLDLIVSNYPFPAREGAQIYSRSVGKLPVSIYGIEKFKSVKRNFPQSLNGASLVLPTAHSKLRHDLDHYFKSNDIKHTSVAETQDTSLQKLIAKHGIGLTPLPEIEEAREPELVKLGRLEGVYEEIWLVSAKRKLENRIAAELLKVFSLK